MVMRIIKIIVTSPASGLMVFFLSGVVSDWASFLFSNVKQMSMGLIKTKLFYFSIVYLVFSFSTGVASCQESLDIATAGEVLSTSSGSGYSQVEKTKLYYLLCTAALLLVNLMSLLTLSTAYLFHFYFCEWRGQKPWAPFNEILSLCIRYIRHDIVNGAIPWPLTLNAFGTYVCVVLVVQLLCSISLVSLEVLGAFDWFVLKAPGEAVNPIIPFDFPHSLEDGNSVKPEQGPTAAQAAKQGAYFCCFASMLVAAGVILWYISQ